MPPPEARLGAEDRYPVGVRAVVEVADQRDRPVGALRQPGQDHPQRRGFRSAPDRRQGRTECRAVRLERIDLRFDGIEVGRKLRFQVGAQDVERGQVVHAVSGKRQLHHGAREELDLDVDIVVGPVALRSLVSVRALDETELFRE